ncbi:hypothetical protein AJ88_05285 [Mesorhizobium amorphae CCBAU 01583]|nr:hypothetical protein AJ88_05285 [Mesorhizobium amorphae CCBAU 01583]
MVEVIDRLLQVEEEALLLGPLLRDVRELPSEQGKRWPGTAKVRARARYQRAPGSAPGLIDCASRNSPSPGWPSRRPMPDDRWSSRPQERRKAAPRPS